MGTGVNLCYSRSLGIRERERERERDRLRVRASFLYIFIFQPKAFVVAPQHYYAIGLTCFCFQAPEDEAAQALEE